MKKHVVAAMSAIVALVAAGAAAQDNQQPVELVSKIVPVELYTCSYRDGQGPADLDEAVDAWTGYMDENDVDDYAAWTLTKFYYGTNQDFDLIWLGAWSDGNAMGRGMEMFRASGGPYMANFNRVVSCDNHVNSGSLAYKLPEGGAPTDSGVITFSNCKVEDGANYAQIVGATKEWADVLTKAGSQAAIYHWFPIYGGGGDDTPDFVWIGAYPSRTEMGADYERLTNGELFRQRNRLFGDLVDCDVSRAYDARVRRAAQIR